MNGTTETASPESCCPEALAMEIFHVSFPRAGGAGSDEISVHFICCLVEVTTSPAAYFIACESFAQSITPPSVVSDGDDEPPHPATIPTASAAQQWTTKRG